LHAGGKQENQQAAAKEGGRQNARVHGQQRNVTFPEIRPQVQRAQPHVALDNWHPDNGATVGKCDRAFRSPGGNRRIGFLRAEDAKGRIVGVKDVSPDNLRFQFERREEAVRRLGVLGGQRNDAVLRCNGGQ